jgi:hypothetical protein
MWSWLQENSASLQVLVSLLSAGVWIFYLHVFVSSYRRQTRSSLLISRDGAHGLKGRCVISNMGSEPAFLMDVLAEFETEGKRFTASVVDRQELWESDDDPGTEIAAKGPISSGGHVDIGSFKDIVSRSQKVFNSEDFTRDVLRVRLIAIAATSQARELVAACRSFEFDFDANGDVIHVRPLQIVAEQIRSRRKRKKLSKLLEQTQRDEAMNEPVADDLVADRSILGTADGLR